jgi:fatty-acyl-CoA synthase
VEKFLYQLPFVSLAAVLELPDTKLGEIVCACIILREEAQVTTKEIIDYWKKRLANYKIPKGIEFMESLPTALATNKIRKSALVEILKEKVGEQRGSLTDDG